MIPESFLKISLASWCEGENISLLTSPSVVSWSYTETHPLHAVAVPDLQLLLGPLEAAVLLVISRRLEVDIHVVGGLGSWGHGCKVTSRR